MEEQLVMLVDPWQDKYDRLLEAHEKLQKLNQCLEDKLLKLAEEHHVETTQLSNQIQELTQRLVEARLYIHQLEDENERYRNDINVVVQLLQCKPSNFISPKIDTLPEDLQRKVLGQRNGVCSGSGRKEKKIIKVQVPTFPPTDIMYAVDKGRGKRNGDKDIVSAAIMARVLLERENERKENRKNRCQCASRIVLPTLNKETQTLPSCTISYSDFPFSEDTTIAQSTHAIPTTANLVDIMKDSIKEEDFSTVPTLTTRRNNYRETSFIHQSSSSSLSSPSSSSTHMAHELSSSVLSPIITTNTTNSSNTTTSSAPSAGRKLAGHCIRVTNTNDESLNKDTSENNENGCHGVVTHWRTTVLVQHPPKSLEAHQLQHQLQSPVSHGLGLGHGHYNHGHGEGITSSYSSGSGSGPADLLDSDESLQSYQCAVPYPAHQYYRAQKRTFWTRSSSTTSTETEI